MKKKTNPEYIEKAKALVARDKAMKSDQQRYSDMSQLIYSLPSNLAKLDWVRKMVSTLPYDALRGVARALSNLDHDISIDPVTVMKAIGDDESADAKKMANDWERILKWELGRSSKRRRNLRADMMWNAAVYDEIVLQLIHLPTQFKLSKPSLAKKRAAMRFGDWAVMNVDPRSVYVTYSEYMPEAVLRATVRDARDLINEWPGLVPELEKTIRDDPEAANWFYIEFDYVDHDMGRVVWYAKGESVEEGADGEGHYILEPEPWLKVASGEGKGQQVPFLNYVAVAGSDPRRPLLYPLLRSGSWESSNIMKTIVMSKAIATAAAPEHIIYGPGGEDIEIDYRTPGGRLTLPTTQLHKYEPAPQRQLDQGMLEGADRLEADMQRATVAEVLVHARPISGEQAYASFSLQVQQALASIGNIKELGERGMEQLNENMLLISHFTGEDIESYMGGTKKYVINSEDIDPDNIQLSVELKTDVAMDRLSRINAASQLAGSGVPYPMKMILESLGETDPEGAMKLYKREQMEMADHAGVVQMIQMERSGELQQMAQEMAMGMLQQMQEQAAQDPNAQGPNGQQANPANLMRPQGGMAGIGGQGFNPAQGGQPAAMANPGGATREARQAVAGLGPIGRA